MIKKKQSLMKQRRNAIIIASIIVLILAVALAFILDFARTEAIEDPIDGSTYYIRYKNKAYKLFDADKKTVRPTDEAYGYYVMKSGTLVEIDAETGAYDVIVVDMPTEGNETIEYFSRYLMFPHFQRASIRQIDVFNAGGSYTFYRYNLEENKVDNTSDFQIKGSHLTMFDGQKFSALCVNAGYTISKMKIADPIKDENGEYTEYGLAPQIRPLYDEKTGEPVMMYDADGKPVLDVDGKHKQETYEYVPAYFILTDTNGNQYKVIIGDKLVDGSGYYAQYVDMLTGTEIKRDAVYVLDTTYGDTVLMDVEYYATPLLTRPLSLNNFFDVEDFFIFERNPNATSVDDMYKVTVGFSYIDIADRENTIYANEPFVFSGYTLDGYGVSNDNVYTCLESFYEPSFVKVCKLAPNDEDLVKYGLAHIDGYDEKGEPKYVLSAKNIISFNFDLTDDDGKYLETVNYMIYVSDFNEDGNRYAFTEVYEVESDGTAGELLYTFDMIIEVEEYTFAFLEWDSYDWINENYVQLNIAFCDKITVSAKDYFAQFTLDNSKSDMENQINSSNLTVHATDSNGNDRQTFSGLTVTDVNGNVWEIGSTTVKCFNSKGTELRITYSHYETNAIGNNTRVLEKYIECQDGSKVYVTANEVQIVALSPDQSVTYNRFDTNLFRQFYQTLLNSRIANSYHLTDEEEKAIIEDESRLMLTMTVLDSEGREKTYRFYSLTSRKAYITINGNGGFYVQADRMERIISDVQKFFANQKIG